MLIKYNYQSLRCHRLQNSFIFNIFGAHYSPTYEFWDLGPSLNIPIPYLHFQHSTYFLLPSSQWYKRLNYTVQTSSLAIRLYQHTPPPSSSFLLLLPTNTLVMTDGAGSYKVLTTSPISLFTHARSATDNVLH